jgi:hypothetical protein
MADDSELHRIFISEQRPGDIVPDALRDLAFELRDPSNLSDAEFRRIVTLWLGRVNRAEYAPTDQWRDLAIPPDNTK